MLWSQTYATGNEVVDNEHKEIFAMVEKLLEDGFEGRAEKIKTAVDFLVDYVGSHFNNEKQLMMECGYPQKDAHLKQHDDFVEVVSNLVTGIKSEYDSIDLSLEVNEVIVSWLAQHTMSSDKAMIEHYKVWCANTGR